MQDQVPASTEMVDPNAAGAMLDPGQASLDVSSALPPGMDRLDLLMGNTDSLALSKMGFAHLIQNIDVIGLYWGGYNSFAPQVLTRSLADLMALYAQGALHPHVSHTLPLERTAEAMDLLRSRASTGKVVVTM